MKGSPPVCSGSGLKRIAVHFPAGGGVDPFESLPEHTGGAPFVVLRNSLREGGYDIAVASKCSLAECAWVFVFDIYAGVFPMALHGPLGAFKHAVKRLLPAASRTGMTFYEQCVQARVADRLVLFLWEPPAVLPANYN